MGLDISAFSKIKKITDSERIEDGMWSILVQRIHPELERSSDIEEGYYDGDGDSFDFRAGSYSGYNEFRFHLSNAILKVQPRAVWDKSEWYVGKPFYELINFSDCEGTIGPAVSKKLHDDFVNYRNVFKTHILDMFPHYENYLMRVYDDFTTGFEMASKGGVLVFH